MNRTEFIKKGPMYQVIILIALPLVINNFLQNLFDLSSTFWLGHLGEAEFAATSFVWPITFMFMSIGFGIYVAGAAILAQLIGSDKLEQANRYANHILVITFFLGILLTLLGWAFSPAFVDMMQANLEIRQHSIDYLQVSFLGFPFIAVYFAFQAILNAQGRTKEMLTANGISLILNILISPFLIFSRIPFLGLPGLGWEVKGAALATVVAKAVLCAIGFLLLKRHSSLIRFDLHAYRPEKKAYGQIFRIALPSMLGQGGASFGFAMLNAFITSYGTAVISAYALGNRITGIVMLPGMGIGGGLTSIVGQNLGAGLKDRVYEAFRKANLINLVVTVSGALLLLLFDRQVLAFFLKEGQNSVVFKEALFYTRFILPTIPLMGMFSIFQGLFQGAGFTRYSMYMEIGRLWVIRIPMILLFKNFTTLGSTGIWIAMTASNLVTILYGYCLYTAKRWTNSMMFADSRR